jgi:uncharacterized phage infection (PIP) family protein YhgE
MTVSNDLTKPQDGSQDGAIAELKEMIREIAGTVQAIDSRLIAVESVVSQRFAETRPIWERALAEIGGLRGEVHELRAGQNELRAGQNELRAGQDELRHGQRHLNERIDELARGQDELRKGQEQLRSDMMISLHKIERQVMRLSKDFLEIRAEQDMLEDRVERLEPQRP